MVKLKILSLVLGIPLILIGCISENTPRENHAISSTTIPSSTLLPTATLTLIPTETKTSVPTATVIIPAPTLYLTPLPTLSFYETVNLLYEANNICSLLCWWGITPGISTWAEAKQYIEHFNPSLSYGVEKVSNPRIPITKSTQSEMYVWWVWPPESRATTGVYLDVQNNIVTAIRVTQDLFTPFFPIYKFLEAADKPDRVLIYIDGYAKNNNIYDAFLYLVYEQKHILASYVYWGIETTNAVNLCLQHNSPQEGWTSPDLLRFRAKKA